TEGRTRSGSACGDAAAWRVGTPQGGVFGAARLDAGPARGKSL
ncbi:MAG: hypothetical protein AVDCRST_MAG93-9577, partial [uncultured Chloroflexia bacterium]